MINLVGIGLGPTVIALITDYGFQDDMAVGDSIALVAVICFVLATGLLLAAHRPFQQRVNEVIYDKT